MVEEEMTFKWLGPGEHGRCLLPMRSCTADCPIAVKKGDRWACVVVTLMERLDRAEGLMKSITDALLRIEATLQTRR